MAREDQRSAPDERIEEYLRNHVELSPENRTVFDPLKRGRLPLMGMGLVGFAIGVFLWGSLFMAMVSGVGSVVDSDSADATTSQGGNGESTASEAAPLNCDVLAGRATLTGEEELFFQQECVEEEEEEVAATDEAAEDEGPADPLVNRENCDEIRGNAYFSPEERTWFLDNCVTN
jgi:hypothetical protein